jgi:hypothetical protein
MYVNVYTYIFLHIYVYVYTYICVYLYINICMLDIFIHKYMYVGYKTTGRITELYQDVISSHEG